METEEEVVTFTTDNISDEEASLLGRLFQQRQAELKVVKQKRPLFITKRATPLSQPFEADLDDIKDNLGFGGVWQVGAPGTPVERMGLFLDACQARQLKATIVFHDSFPKQDASGQWQLGTINLQFIQAFQNHPALLFLYLLDEPARQDYMTTNGKFNVAALESLYAHVKTLAPGVAQVLQFSQELWKRRIMPTKKMADVFWYQYLCCQWNKRGLATFAFKDFKTNILESSKLVNAVAPDAPNVIGVQAFGSKSYQPQDRINWRQPTLAESEQMLAFVKSLAGQDKPAFVSAQSYSGGQFNLSDRPTADPYRELWRSYAQG